MRFPIDGGFKIEDTDDRRCLETTVAQRPLPSRSGISVPAFCVHTYFAPGGARGSAPFVSIHTLLELGAQYTFSH
jgi:hypothetical protein